MTKKTKGTLFAMGTAFFQGGEGILFMLFGLSLFTASAISTPEFAAASLAVKELFGITFTFAILYKRIIPAFRSVKNKHGKWLLASGVSTAFGNFFFFLGIAYAGASYGVILTTLYPIFSMIAVRIFFKEKQNNMVKIGIILSIVSGLLFMFLPTFLSGDGFELDMMIGMVASILAAIFWAGEGICIKVSNDVKGNDLKSSDKIILRSTSVLVMTFAFIMPIMMAFQSSGSNSFEWFGIIMSHWLPLIIGIVLGINIVLMRLCHLLSISMIGPKLAAVIDTNNFLVPAFMSIFLSMGNILNVVTNEQLFNPIIWWAWLLLLPLATGVFLVVYFDGKDEKTFFKNILKK